MFSRILLLNFCALVVLQCTPKIGEEPPKAPEQKIEGTACLADALSAIEKFAVGTAADSEILSAFGCGKTALIAFKRYVRGRENDRYSTQELASFIEQNFLSAEANSSKFKTKKISPELQLEVMKIKRIFIGGSVSELTFPELDQLIELLSQISNIAVDLNPYMVLLLNKWVPEQPKNFDANSKFFEAGNKAVQKAAKDLTSLIEKQNPEYVLSDLKKLFEAVQVLYGENWTVIESLDKFLPTFQKLKKALAGGEENIVKPAEWRSFLLLAGRGYMQYLRYHYFITDNIEENYNQDAVWIFRTIEDMFSIFEDLVNTKASGMVTTAEISEILGTISKIWPNFVSSNSLLGEVMKVKKLVFGGSVDNWNVKDFAKGQSKLQNLRHISDLLFPYYRLYTMNWDSNKLSEDEAQQMFQSSRESLSQVAVLASEVFEGDYNYEDFGKLVAEIHKLYPNLKAFRPTSIAESLSKYKGLFIFFKKTVFQESSTTIKLSQWPKTLNLIQSFFSEYLYYHYFIEKEKFVSDRLAPRVKRWSNNLIATMTLFLKSLPNQQLTKKQLLDLMDELQDLDVLTTVKKDTSEKVVELVLNRVLVTPKDRLLNHVKSSAFGLKSLQVLEEELNNWLDVEVFLRKLVPGQSQVSYAGLKENIVFKLKEKKLSVSMSTGLTEVQRNLLTNFPMTYDRKGQLIIDQKNPYTFDARGMSYLNLTRMLSRLILRSAGEDLQRIENYVGVNQAEATNLFHPIKNVLEDLGLVKSIKPTFINSRFIEANIFLPNSTGDDLANYAELTDLLATVFSGLMVNSKLEKYLASDCFGGKSVGDKVAFACLSKSYRKHLPEVMTATPQFLEYLRTLSDENWQIFLDGALRGAGDGPDKQDMAAMRDVALIPFVIQYIELLYLKYDVNRNGLIEYEDAKVAFPLFAGLLTQLAQENIDKGLLSKKDMFPMFCYIIHYGTPPTAVLDYLFKWQPFKNSPSSQQAISADRTQVAKIIGYLSEQATSFLRIDPDVELQMKNLSQVVQ